MSAYLYHKRDKVLKKVENIFGMGIVPSEQVLLTFNNEPMEVQDEFLDMKSDSTPHNAVSW